MKASLTSCLLSPLSLVVLALAAPAEQVLIQAQPQPVPADQPAPRLPPGVALGQFSDGSSLRLTILEKELVLNTEFGKLLIPLSAVERIDFGLRLSEATLREIEAQIEKLGSGEFSERQAAEKRLIALGEKAYPAVLRLSKQEGIEVEVLQRAQGILTKLEETLSEEQRDLPDHDVVHTARSRIAGQIEGDAFAARTIQFGEVKLRLADVRSLQMRETGADFDPALVSEGPSNLYNLREYIGKAFYFRVAGTNQGALYGTGVYTADSTLGMAAVHAGVLKPGQVGVVKVTIVTPPPVFQSSTQNGVTSSAYGAYPGAYRVDRVRR